MSTYWCILYKQLWMLWLLPLPLGGLVYSVILQRSTLLYYESSQPKKKLKNQDERREKRRKKIYTPFSWFVLISGTGLVLACRSDFESYYRFGSWHFTLAYGRVTHQIGLIFAAMDRSDDHLLNGGAGFYNSMLWWGRFGEGGSGGACGFCRTS